MNLKCDKLALNIPQSSLKNYGEIINDKIKNKYAASGTRSLKEACEYALQSGGKRCRPSLVFMIAEALNQQTDVSSPALAIEYFHTASLVADDLPCMDDDDERRNKPTVHKLYGETTALLTSYALIADGYGAIAEGLAGFVQGNPKKEAVGAKIVVLALENAAFNTGLSGATGGQFLDIFPLELSEESLREIIHKKTTSLFEIAFVFGWLFGGGDPVLLPSVKRCASHFGMAFQVADDFDDVVQDEKNGRKINTVNLFGLERAKQIFKNEILGYRLSLKELKIDSISLLALASSLEDQLK